MFDAGSLPTETPALRGPHLAQPAGGPQATTRPSGGATYRGDCQTLTRALDLMFAIAEDGPMKLGELQRRLGLTKSTTYRLASAMVGRKLLVRTDQLYGLGPKLIDLASTAPEQAA